VAETVSSPPDSGRAMAVLPPMSFGANAPRCSAAANADAVAKAQVEDFLRGAHAQREKRPESL